MKALYAGLHGWRDTAPHAAVEWFKRARFVNGHAGWTYRDYDEASAADILLDADYHALIAEMSNK